MQCCSEPSSVKVVKSIADGMQIPIFSKTEAP